MINIKNLNLKYRDKIIFKDFNLKIGDKKIVSILGQNGSGKTSLMRVLLGLEQFEGTVEINGRLLNNQNKKNIRKEIGIVFSNPDNQFINEIVIDDITSILENMNYKKEKITERLGYVVNLLNIKEILYCNPNQLNINQKQLVLLACALVHEPKILILDELNNLDDKEQINKILLELKKDMLIINITQDIEDTLISDEVILLDKGNLVLQTTKEKLYENEKILSHLGFKLPFMVELSNRLIFYNLIDNVTYDMKELVDLLWK